MCLCAHQLSGTYMCLENELAYYEYTVVIIFLNKHIVFLARKNTACGMLPSTKSLHFSKV
mgnify:CR=1 FL=1